MNKKPQEEILSASAGWIAFLLNIVPGLGTGYIYQRRWKAYWLTFLVTLSWTLFIVSKQLNIDPSDPFVSTDDQLGFTGVLIISFVTAVESIIAIRNTRKSLNNECSK